MKFFSITVFIISLMHVNTVFSQDRGFPLSSSIWNTLNINVCWENISAAPLNERNWVRNAISGTWEAHSDVRFLGWGQCGQNSNGIRIRVSDQGPHVVALGDNLNGVKNGMVLNFTYSNWGTSCQFTRQYCSETIAVHEFGHALGFAHEQNRADAPDTCTDDPQGSNGDIFFGNWDLLSVMNYCNPQWSGSGNLSNTDIEMVSAFYSSLDNDNQHAYNSIQTIDRGYASFRELADVNGDGYNVCLRQLCMN